MSNLMNRDTNICRYHPPTDHLKDLLIAFMGVVKSWGVYKHELVAVFFVTKDPMRRDFVGDRL